MTNYGKEYLNYLKNRSLPRRIIRYLYIKNILRNIDGKIVDLGCGTGDLLKLAKKGSIGLEINREAVQFCRKKGLDVEYYDSSKDNFSLSNIKRERKYSALVLCHVLEHLEAPDKVVRNLVKACFNLGISKLVFVVPGSKGFKFDRTHVTYVDEKYLIDHRLFTIRGYKICKRQYFPFNLSWMGNFFTYNELIFVYEREK